MPNAFISFTQADAPVAREVEAVLQQFGVATLDASSIPLGSNLSQSINDMLREADAYVFLVSKSFAMSEWANLEMAAAIADTTQGRAKPIVPILVGDVDPDRDLPELLRRYLWLDLREGVSQDRLAKLAASLSKDLRQGSTAGQLDSEEAVLQLRRQQLETERLEYQRHLNASREGHAAVMGRALLWTTAVGTALAVMAVLTSLGVVGNASSSWIGVAGALVGATATGLLDRWMLFKRKTLDESEGSRDVE